MSFYTFFCVLSTIVNTLFLFLYRIAGTTSGIMFLAFIMDVVVWFKANRIYIDPESKVNEADCSMEKPTITPESTM